VPCPWGGGGREDENERTELRPGPAGEEREGTTPLGRKKRGTCRLSSERKEKKNGKGAGPGR